MANVLTLLMDGKEYPIPAIQGAPPVKGVDYFTPADVQELVAAVIAALPVYDGEVEGE